MTAIADGADRVPPVEFGGRMVRVLAAGWLDGRDFPTGAVDPEWLVRLVAVALRCAAAPTRGLHACPMCARAGRDFDREMLPAVRFPDPVRGSWALGSAELWVPGADGEVWAAPDLIVHYVAAHGYRPPAGFVAAVSRFRGIEAWDAGAFAERAGA